MDNWKKIESNFTRSKPIFGHENLSLQIWLSKKTTTQHKPVCVPTNAENYQQTNVLRTNKRICPIYPYIAELTALIGLLVSNRMILTIICLWNMLINSPFNRCSVQPVVEQQQQPRCIFHCSILYHGCTRCTRDSQAMHQSKTIENGFPKSKCNNSEKESEKERQVVEAAVQQM